MALKEVIFETASSTGDWRFPYQILAPVEGGWDPAIDQIVLGMTPDHISWDDYGQRSRSFPPNSGAYDTSPWFQASSDDGSGVITIVPPNLIDINVPANRIRSMGPGSVAVGLQYRNKATGARTTLLSGRLPLADGVI